MSDNPTSPHRWTDYRLRAMPVEDMSHRSYASQKNSCQRRQQPAIVSVIVPVRNGSPLIAAQLEALERQDYGGTWELLIVDNGSTDDTASIALSWARRLPLRIIPAFDKASVSYARNVGVRASSGDLVVFCDADDEVSEQWLSTLVEACLTADAVGGSTDLARLNNPTAVSWNSLTLEDHPRMAGHFLPAVGGGNFAIWCDVIDALGGFNEDYGYGPEDVDLCWRLQLAGYNLAFAPQALIHCRTRSDLRSLARQFFRLGRGSPRLYRDFRSAGMPRSSFLEAAKGWAWLLVHIPDLVRGPSRRGNWIRAAATKTGKIVGSIENRNVYL